MTKFAGTGGKKDLSFSAHSASLREPVFSVCGLAGNLLTENASGGTITTMTTATNRLAVSSALDHDATMGEPRGKPDGAKAGREAGEIERKKTRSAP